MTEAELQQTLSENKRLEHIIQTQELSQADIMRINADREELKRNKQMLDEENEDIDKQTWDLEIKIRKKYDEVMAETIYWYFSLMFFEEWTCISDEFVLL